MATIEVILKQKTKPKEKQKMLVEAVVSEEIPASEFMAFFESAADVDKGTCADVMKHVSAEHPEILVAYVDVLVKYINYRAPRVKWGVPEAIGNIAKEYPDRIESAIPYLLKNTTDEKHNTTVIRWCAAYALAEIAKHNPNTRRKLLPFFRKQTVQEKNNGVKNVYLKAIKAIEKKP